MKLTHPCKDTCSGYSQDCAEQIEALQARVRELEAQLNEKYRKAREETARLARAKEALNDENNALIIEINSIRKVVDAAREYVASNFNRGAKELVDRLRELDGEKK